MWFHLSHPRPGARDGKNSTLPEMEKRQTYKPWTTFSIQNETIVSSTYNAPKQLVHVSYNTSVHFVVLYHRRLSSNSITERALNPTFPSQYSIEYLYLARELISFSNGKHSHRTLLWL